MKKRSGSSRRFGNEGLRPQHRLLALAGLDQRQDQIIRGFPESAGVRRALAEGVDRGIERADAVERFAERVLNIGVARRGAGGIPEERQRGRVVSLSLEPNRACIGVPRRTRLGLPGCRSALRRRKRRGQR